MFNCAPDGAYWAVFLNGQKIISCRDEREARRYVSFLRSGDNRASQAQRT